jgi:hypothetical protein
MEIEKMTRAIRTSINVKPVDFLTRFITMVFDILKILAFIIGNRMAFRIYKLTLEKSIRKWHRVP